MTDRQANFDWLITEEATSRWFHDPWQQPFTFDDSPHEPLPPDRQSFDLSSSYPGAQPFFPLSAGRWQKVNSPLFLSLSPSDTNSRGREKLFITFPAITVILNQAGLWWIAAFEKMADTVFIPDPEPHLCFYREALILMNPSHVLLCFSSSCAIRSLSSALFSSIVSLINANQWMFNCGFYWHDHCVSFDLRRFYGGEYFIGHTRQATTVIQGAA